MIPPDALQVLIITHAKGAQAGDYPRPKDYVETIGNSFTRPETNELVRELSLVDEQGTGVAMRRFYVDSTDPNKGLPPDTQELDKALHTLVVLVVTPALCDDDAVIAQLDLITQAVQNSQPRHDLVVLGTSEETLTRFRTHANANALKTPQGWSLEKLGEVRAAAKSCCDHGIEQSASPAQRRVEKWREMQSTLRAVGSDEVRREATV